MAPGKTRAAAAALFTLAIVLSSAGAHAAGPASDLALADELLGAVQTKLNREEATFARKGDARGVFASVYGDVMTAGIRQAIRDTPERFNAPLEEAIASVAFLPLYAEVNRKIETALPGLRPGVKLTRQDQQKLRAAGVPSHWVSYLKLTQDPRRQNETAATVAGIMAHVLGDLKEVVRADLHAIAKDPRQLEGLLTRALPDAADAPLRAKLMGRVTAGSGYRNPKAFQQDYELLNELIAGKTRDTFRDIASMAEQQDGPDFLAEAGYRAMRGVGPIKFQLPARAASFLLFTSWRGKAWTAGKNLARHDETGNVRAAARTTARSERSAVRRIQLISTAARVAEHPVARPPLRAAAHVLAAWRRAGTPRTPAAPRSR